MCYSLANPVWDSLCFLDLGDYFLSSVIEILSYYVFTYVLNPSLFYFWNPYNIISLDLTPEIFYTVFISFNSFLFFFCSAAVISTTLSSNSLIHSFVSFILLLNPSSIFFHFSYFIFHLCLVFLYIF